MKKQNVKIEFNGNLYDRDLIVSYMRDDLREKLHSEWTDENGHNNALRVNGLGAPRAFDTACIRDIGFLNVSYGEDYAAALRLCREYRIGRIFQSLYLCRRWSGNTDAALSVEAANRNDAFKDAVRTEEIRARQALIGVAPHPSGGYRG